VAAAVAAPAAQAVQQPVAATPAAPAAAQPATSQVLGCIFFCGYVSGFSCLWLQCVWNDIFSLKNCLLLVFSLISLWYPVKHFREFVTIRFQATTDYSAQWAEYYRQYYGQQYAAIAAAAAGSAPAQT